MGNKHLALLATGTLIATSAYGATTAACDDKLMASLHECQRIVGSLHPDKATQMRVFAADVSEFTAGQALWMRGQLRLIDKDCASGNATDASRRLMEVGQLLSEHHHAV